MSPRGRLQVVDALTERGGLAQDGGEVGVGLELGDTVLAGLDQLDEAFQLGWASAAACCAATEASTQGGDQHPWRFHCSFRVSWVPCVALAVTAVWYLVSSRSASASLSVTAAEALSATVMSRATSSR